MCIEGIADCKCPPPEPELDDLPLKPLKPTPVDCLGYPYKFCCCIPLRVAVIFICIISFMWALVELTQSDKLMAAIFPNKDDLYKWSKVLHIFVIFAFLVSCGVMMLGLIVRRFMFIHVYVWSAFIFNCICITLDAAASAVQVISSGNIAKRTIFNLAFGVFWHCIFFYLISVVNSYKFRYWIYE